jgi:hypothetical protein
LAGLTVLQVRTYPVTDLTPLPPDIPRATVEDLLAAVNARVVALGEPGWEAVAAELDFVATALRRLLGGES